ncbi:MAG: 30S ribosomal protein S9 [Deltaproteobacteria bacterium]|nr:30S ribosomal protein S9 [Deltaproteobacteria bacterium]
MEGKQYFATGRRKRAIARVWMEPGDGKVFINKKTMDDFFGGLEVKKAAVKQAMVLTDTMGKYNVHVNVCGGGTTGQAEAIRHGIARTLLKIDPELRGTLKKTSLLTRDSRKIERKKYGQKGARARFQFSKR